MNRILEKKTLSSSSENTISMLCYQIFTICPREVEATDKIGMRQALQAMLHFMS